MTDQVAWGVAGTTTRRGYDAIALLTDGWFAGTVFPALSVAGIDVADFIPWETLTVTKSIQSFRRTATAAFSLLSPTFKPLAGYEVIFEIPAGTKRFAGRIASANEKDLGYNELGYDVQCQDYAADLDKRLVVQTFDQAQAIPSDYAGDYTFASIVAWLVTKYANQDAQGNTIDTFTTGALEAGGEALPPIQFNYLPLTQCLDQLAQLAGHTWYVDYDRGLHSFTASEGPAPATLDESMEGFEDFELEADYSQVKNRIVVAGSQTVTRAEKFAWTNSGSRVFRLGYRFTDPADITAVTVGGDDAGVPGYDLTIDGAPASGEANVYANADSRLLRFDDAYSHADGTIEVTYTSYEPVLVVAEDTMAQAALAQQLGLTEAGAGVREDRIDDSSISTEEAAQQFAQTKLAECKDPRVTGRVKYHYPGMEVGQTLRVAYNTRSNDSTVQRYGDRGLPLSWATTIQAVTFRMIPTDLEVFPLDFGEWDVTFGSPLYDLQQILSQILRDQRRRQPLSTETLQQVLTPSDTLAINDRDDLGEPTTTINNNLAFTYEGGINDCQYGFGQYL